MKCLSDRIKRSLCLTLSVLLILLSIPASGLYADDLSVKYYSVEEDVSYEVRHQIDSSWNSHANVTLFVKNTGSKTINNWFLTFEYPYEIENIWGASLIERDNNTYTVRNSIFNQDIKAGQEVSFGMTVRSDGSDITEFPSWYLMNMKEYEVDTSKYLLTYQEYSKWNGGFNGALMLSSQETIEDWKMVLRSGYEITNISNAILTVNEDGSYEISNDGYTQNLSYNTLVMNIQGIPSDNGISLTDVTMYSIGLAYGLTEDQDNNGTPDYRDLISSIGGTDIVTPTPTTEPTVTDTPTVTTEPVYEKNDLWVDRDGDGLSDDEEFMFGTDPDKYDTDGDGINDNSELCIGYNPNNPDSDFDGISDGDEDYDSDGITNKAEEELGICLYFSDTDFDDMNDYDEIYVYKTDPDKEDTNDDGILDGDALILGFDPASLDSDGNGIADKDEKIYQEISLQIDPEAELQGVSKVEVKGEFTNLISSTTRIEDVYGKDIYSSQIDAVVGGLVSIETTSDFDTATIIFHYNEDEIGVDEDDLCILWYDEANGEYVMLDEEQVLDKANNTISYETTHFSTYMVVSKSEWFNMWEESINTILENRKEYLGIGDTKYIVALKTTYGDSQQYRTALFNAFSALTTGFSDDNLAGVFVYSWEAYYFKNSSSYPLSTVDEYFTAVMRNLWTYNGDGYTYTDWNYLFRFANAYRNYFMSQDDEVILYILTDEEDIDLDLYSELVEEYGFKVVVVSIYSDEVSNTTSWGSVVNYGEEGCESYPEDIRDAFIERIAENEANILGNTTEVDITIDTDGDTLTDFEEITGILLSNGKVIYTLPDRADTDNDTLTDDEELGTSSDVSSLNVSARSEINRGKPLDGAGIRCWRSLSDPTLEDSDFDLCKDYMDYRCYTSNPDMIYIFAFVDGEKNTGKYDASPKNQARRLKKAYEDDDREVTPYNFNSTESFCLNWRKIGLSYDDIRYGRFNGKYYFNVTNVVIVSHGTNFGILTSKNGRYLVAGSYDENNKYDCIDILPDKVIRSLNLYICNGGEKIKGCCLAENFLENFEGISSVIAFDVTLGIYYNGDDYTYYGFWFDEKIQDMDTFLKLQEKNKKQELGISDEGNRVLKIRADETVDLTKMGFAKFYRDESIIKKDDIYDNDMYYTTFYWYPDEDVGFIECDSSMVDYSEKHDPIIKE